MAADSLHIAHPVDFPAPPAPRRGWLVRLFRAVRHARQAAAEREVARMVDRCGHKMTDQLERRIGDHFV